MGRVSKEKDTMKAYHDIKNLHFSGEYMILTIDGEENSLYLMSAETKMIMSVNLISKKKSLIIDVGERPSWMTMMGER